MTLEEAVKLSEETGFCLYRIAEYDRGVLTNRDVVPSNACQNSYSVSKAFTMTAVGLLFDRGMLRPEDRIYPLFEKEFPDGFDRKWKDVTVDNALTHKIGFEQGFLDIDVEDVSTYGTDDYLSVVLRHPLKYAPGTVEVYSDAAFYLLSRVVERVSGMKTDDLLLRELFTPLGFQEVAWSHCPYGHPMGATGLYIRAQDMAKLGELYLRGGVWQGRRILSEEWVGLALARGYELRPTGAGYGKGGMLGQMLFVVPGKEQVFAWHGYARDGSDYEFFKRMIAGM